MTQLKAYIEAVSEARGQFIEEASGLSHEQSQFKPARDVWSVCEITEHIVWAERAGLYKMWMAIDDFKQSQKLWEGEVIHQGLPIEAIIAKTWRPKEIVPEIAKPRWGGPIAFWVASLEACQALLDKLVLALEGLDPEQIIYPHPISGPLNIYQRIDFLRFHMKRHQQQINRVKASAKYPKN